VWHFPGREGALAGSHRGHDAIFRFLVDAMQLTDSSFTLDLEGVLADDHTAVAFFRGHGRRKGLELDYPTCLKIRLQDGRAVGFREFVWDLHAVDEFWS
jgi:ketosteroid isomerase-like protein